MAMVTCHTGGCENEGVPIDAMTQWQDEETGETRYTDAVVCGPCGQPITDVDPPLPERTPR